MQREPEAVTTNPRESPGRKLDNRRKTGNRNEHAEYVKREGLGCRPHAVTLESTVGRENDVHAIDVNGGFEKLHVILLVMRDFSNSQRSSRPCAS